VALKYFHNRTLTEAGAAVGAVHVFRLNDLFDPDYTAAGGQPIGRDIFATLYERYKVFHTKARLCFVNDTGATVRVGYALTQQAAASADPNAWGSNPRSKWEMLSDQSSGGSKKTFAINACLADVFGVRRSEYVNSLEFGQAIGATPAWCVYLHVFVVGITTAASVQFAIELTFDTEFSLPILLTFS
jgi:hypothetical protein